MHRPGLAWPLLLALASLALLVAWALMMRVTHRPEPGLGQRFAQWKSARPQQIAAYLSFLESKGVGEVLPAEQLLRQGRRWTDCGGIEFGLTPAKLWPEMVPTLQLLADLRSEGLLVDARAASGYRTSDYNRCEGGSPASRHLSNQAIDLDLAASTVPQTRALCAAWRKLGPARKWGLGFYSPTRVHLDTSGFRTWGYDFHAPSSLCVMPGPN